MVAGAEAGLIGFDVKPIFLLLASIAIVASVRANIGENEEKINSSYGNRIERRIRDKSGKDTAHLERKAGRLAISTSKAITYSWLCSKRI